MQRFREQEQFEKWNTVLKKKIEREAPFAEVGEKVIGYPIWRSSVYRGKDESNFDMNNFWVAYYIERERG